MIKASGCVDENYGLGYKGELLFHISEDLKRFKELTLGQLCVMGRLTYQSLPSTLTHRTNIILTHNKHYKPEDKRVVVEHDVNKIINHYSSGTQSKDMYIIGGQDIFKAFLPYCEEIEITRVKAKASKCDTYFPFGFLKEFDIVHIETNWSDKYECEYDFITYKRKEDVVGEGE